MMSNKRREIIVLKNVGIIFRNFAGEARRLNNAGDRNFNASVSKDQADMLRSKGFRIKELAPNEYSDETTYLLKVKVSYRFDAPNVNVITSRCTRRLGEETIGELDRMSIENCDISITGSAWTKPSGESGVTAYLSSLYATLREDPLALEYSSMDNEEDPF